MLIDKGKYNEEGEVGCSICQKKKRVTHWKKKYENVFKLNKSIPTMSDVESFSFYGIRTRLLSIREQIKKIKGKDKLWNLP